MKKPKISEPIKGHNTRLNPSQKRFCEEYVIDYNGTRSYMTAYPGVKNNRVAGVCASKLLRFAKVREYISELENNLARTIGVSPVRIGLEYKKLAFSSIADLHNTWISRKEFEELTDEQKSCIAEIDTKTRTEFEYEPGSDKKRPIQVEYVKIKLYDKLAALQALRNMLGVDEPQKFEIDFNKLTDEQLEKIYTMLLTKIK